MIIVDSSVALKWLLSLDEDYVQEAGSLLEDHLLKKVIISIPDLLQYEISNALITKAHLSQHVALGLISKFYGFELNLLYPDKSIVLKAAESAKKYKTSVYDMLYAVIAKENKCNLITADDRFIKKTGFRFVKHLRDY